MRPERYAFGPFLLDVAERRLARGAEPIHLAPKAHDLLVALVRHAGRLVTKQELLDGVWPDAFVEEGILTVHVSALRKVLGDGEGNGYIETVPRAGYRFVGAVTGANERPRPPGDDARPLEAHELVGRGRAHLLSASFFELPHAVAAFTEAIRVDPTFGAAHAGLAQARCAQASLGALPHVEAYASAKASALRALAMDQVSADAQVALGQVLFLAEWDGLGAERSFQRALDINPDHAEAYLWYGSLLEARGALERGLRTKQQAMQRDPASAFVLLQIATSFWYQRRYDEAIRWGERAHQANPQHLLAREFLHDAYWKAGDLERLLATHRSHAEAFGVAEEVAAVTEAADQLRVASRRDGMRGVARHLLEHSLFPGVGGSAARMAMLAAAVGESDAAFARLDAAIAERDPGVVHLAVAPQWDGLRDDPRFAERLARVRL